jgi:hypothetical protein
VQTTCGLGTELLRLATGGLRFTLPRSHFSAACSVGRLLYYPLNGSQRGRMPFSLCNFIALHSWHGSNTASIRCFRAISIPKTPSLAILTRTATLGICGPTRFRSPCGRHAANGCGSGRAQAQLAPDSSSIGGACVINGVCRNSIAEPVEVQGE